jgi:hypothetical protein
MIPWAAAERNLRESSTDITILQPNHLPESDSLCANERTRTIQKTANIHPGYFIGLSPPVFVGGGVVIVIGGLVIGGLCSSFIFISHFPRYLWKEKPFTMSETKPLIKNQSDDEIEHLRRLKAYQP